MTDRIFEPEPEEEDEKSLKQRIENIQVDLSTGADLSSLELPEVDGLKLFFILGEIAIICYLLLGLTGQVPLF